MDGWDHEAGVAGTAAFASLADVELKRARRDYREASLVSLRLAPGTSPAVARALLDLVSRWMPGRMGASGRTPDGAFAMLLYDVPDAHLSALPQRLREMGHGRVDAVALARWDGGETITRLLTRARLPRTG